MSGWRSVQGRPMSSAGCSEPEQSCPGLARQALRCFSMKSPCCVRNVYRLQVPWGFNGPICLHMSQILLYSHLLEKRMTRLLLKKPFASKNNVSLKINDSSEYHKAAMKSTNVCKRCCVHIIHDSSCTGLLWSSLLPGILDNVILSFIVSLSN